MNNEVAIRLAAFAAVFVTMAVVETLLPRRERAVGRARRWFTNLSITAAGSAVVRVMAFASVPLTATLAAAWASSEGIGLLNAVTAPGWIEMALALVVLDASIWLQHLLSHKVPLLWRIHRVHHADRDIDATTALRFHPAEIALSMLYKVAIVLVVGPSVLTVVVFEIALNGFALFNHANIRLPLELDRILRAVLVTPDVHRVHHSVHRDEHDSNYGFSITLWDRLFRTYRASPRDGHEHMVIGLAEYQTKAPARLGWSLWLPLINRASGRNRD